MKVVKKSASFACRVRTPHDLLSYSFKSAVPEEIQPAVRVHSQTTMGAAYSLMYTPVTLSLYKTCSEL